MHNLDLFQLSGYKMLLKYCASKNGGGVAIYIANYFNFKVYIANNFNQYFISFGKKLLDEIQDISNGSNYCHLVANSIFLRYTNECEILRIVNLLSSKNSCDCNGMSMVNIKMIIKAIHKPLTFIM